MSLVFRSPNGYVQGRGVAADLGMHAGDLGETALLLADDVVMDLVVDPVVESLEANDVAVETEVFGGECSATEIQRVTDIAAEYDADVIVGAGGGKALDTAKAVREDLGVAMVSMPTVASTDAPTSSLSVVYSEDGEFEEYRFHARNPELVLVDTELVAAAPSRLFASGIGDALATWFEVDATVRSDGTNIFGEHPTVASKAIARRCYDTLRAHGVSALGSVDHDAVTESVEAVTEANTLLSGLGFESGGLAAAHAVHNGLTQLEATHGATHGEKVAFGTIVQLVLEGRNDAYIQDVVYFADSVDLPVTLDGIGVTRLSEEELDVVAEAACAPDETIHNEPFEVTPAMVRDAIIGADALAHRYLG